MPTTSRPARALLALLVAGGLLGAACSSDDEPTVRAPTTTLPSDGEPVVRQPALDGTLKVAAADSLAGVMATLVTEFNATNPGVTVEVRHGSSATLATEIASDATDDLFISADLATMTIAVGAERIDVAPLIVARNTLVIVTAPGNPTGITGLADLARADRVALCETATPCGSFAERVFEQSGITVPSGAIERYETASATIDAVVAGDADATVLYATMADEAGDAVTVVSIPEGENTVTNYLIAPVIDGNAIAARSFIDFARGPEGQRIFEDHGFLPRP